MCSDDLHVVPKKNQRKTHDRGDAITVNGSDLAKLGENHSLDEKKEPTAQCMDGPGGFMESFWTILG